MDFDYIWTDGSDPDFVALSLLMEDYYNQLVGGSEKRSSFIPHNALDDIHNVLMVYCDGKPIASAAFKEYDPFTVEVKRVWVCREYRGRHISRTMMELLEKRAKGMGYTRAVLQTREQCLAAVSLYTKMGYSRTSNYPPYDRMAQAICYAKQL
ncbi:MAG: GNAT family N-acetyltransferase [Ruminococcaceae bacterium]|nr:GNAT family N-acetyltransferase [Oscillospiraceae bacterium]